jgi:hypothetical protein
MNLASHFPVRKDLEPFPAVDRPPYIAGNSDTRGTNDRVDVSLFCDEDSVSRSQRAFNATMYMQGAA